MEPNEMWKELGENLGPANSIANIRSANAAANQAESLKNIERLLEEQADPKLREQRLAREAAAMAREAEEAAAAAKQAEKIRKYNKEVREYISKEHGYEWMIKSFFIMLFSLPLGLIGTFYLGIAYLSLSPVIFIAIYLYAQIKGSDKSSFELLMGGFVLSLLISWRPFMWGYKPARAIKQEIKAKFGDSP